MPENIILFHMLNKGDDKKTRILNAAIKTFSHKGFFNTNVSEIAEEAAVADGTIYLYFKNKDSILESIFESTMNNFITDGLAEIKDILDPVTKLKKIITLHLEKLGANRKLAMVFQVELRHTAKFMSEISRKSLKIYLNIIEEVIKDGQKQNLIRKEINPKITTKIIFGAMDEMVTNWILSDKNYNLRDMPEHVIKIILNGIIN